MRGRKTMERVGLQQCIRVKRFGNSAGSEQNVPAPALAGSSPGEMFIPDAATSGSAPTFQTFVGRSNCVSVFIFSIYPSFETGTAISWRFRVRLMLLKMLGRLWLRFRTPIRICMHIIYRGYIPNKLGIMHYVSFYFILFLYYLDLLSFCYYLTIMHLQ